MGRLRLREYSVSPFQLLYRKSEKFRRAAYAFVRMFVVPRNRCNFKLNLALPFTGGISAIPHFRGLSASRLPRLDVLVPGVARERSLTRCGACGDSCRGCCLPSLICFVLVKAGRRSLVVASISHVARLDAVWLVHTGTEVVSVRTGHVRLA